MRTKPKHYLRYGTLKASSAISLLEYAFRPKCLPACLWGRSRFSLSVRLRRLGQHRPRPVLPLLKLWLSLRLSVLALSLSLSLRPSALTRSF